MAGFREFDGAGTLGIDKIFSPQELMIDVEIKKYVENMIKKYFCILTLERRRIYEI